MFLYSRFPTLAHLFYRSVHSTAPRSAATCLERVVILPRQEPYANQDTVPQTRFNWRLRAPSRVKKDDKKEGESSGYLKRLRPVVSGADVGKRSFNAIQRYSEKYVAFLLSSAILH
jgi:hypothetical protein